MSAPRAVRIPRSASNVPPLSSPPTARPLRLPPALAEVQPNRAGTQRVVRLSAIYLIALAALYLAFALYAHAAPGGSGAAGATELLEFTLVAVAIGAAGAILTLSTAPRSVVRRPDGFDVIGRWGRSTEWTPLRDITVRRVRRYPAGFLSQAPVESLEVSGSGHRVRSYLLEAGLLPESSPERRPE